MNALRLALIATSLVLAWIAVFRIPFRSPARRHLIGMWLSERTGLRADAAFAVFATMLYLGLGLAVLLVLSVCAPVPWRSYAGIHSAAAIPLTLLAMAGSSSLSALCMSVIYRVNPDADVPLEMASIQWIKSILALPRAVRWLVPALAAMVEELIFRGAVFLGMGASGASLVQATAVSTVLFAAGQVLVVHTRTQAVVMAAASCTLGVVGSLLVASTGSIIPALAVHMSFAGFYTNMTANPEVRSAQRRFNL
jgi:Type II CAAX prenyl endopeptidase Rce1-like